ncbi:hypothetical protein CKAH01_18422 [Colletotrichum kahawae]|uniref:Uncharacterized protein n=1 Tax=Colletotrichum kahawae TaxID=34407 RepID=A0AAD9Y8M0_COLKA|nr:hypothetical protein CKAH01_18422 [Colletotrichum kahawae]
MQKHRLPSGDYDLPVDGWDTLSRDDRSRLAERLEAQKGSLSLSPTACSRPLDLDDLDARLRRVPPNESFSSRRQSGPKAHSRSPTPPYNPTELETETYHELVRTGGRPLYPIELIQDVQRQPDNYAEMLRPWQEFLNQARAEDIFQRQLQRWQDFRKWQNDNRDREDEDDSFPAYVEREKSMIQRYCLRRSRAKRLAEIEADPSCLKSGWDMQQSLRERQRRLCREHGCRGFRSYVNAVKRRLAAHDFTQPFDLDEDPKKQDRLTTWIEYLNYEYWWLDEHTRDIERLEPEHDKLWQELVEKRILRPHETKEFVRTMASPMERQSEEDQAEKVVRGTESEAKRIFTLTQKHSKRTRIPQAKRISMLKVCTERLLAAKRRFEQVRSRNNQIGDFIRATFDYDEAQREAARQRILVQWVLNQVALIEAETKPSKSNRVKPGARKGTKRQRTIDDVTPETQASKRVKFDLLETTPVNTMASSGATDMQPGSGTLCQAAQDAQSDSFIARGFQQGNNAMQRGVRRSARIAARQDALVKALNPKAPEHMSRSKTEAIVAQSSRQIPTVGHAEARLSKTQSRRKNQDSVAKPGRRSQRLR